MEIRGEGVVSGSVWCRRTCSKAFAPGARIVLRKTPASGRIVFRWPGACPSYHESRFVLAADATRVVHFRAACR